MEEDIVIKELDQVVVRFSGDSGDGMQLAGNIFSTINYSLFSICSVCKNICAKNPIKSISEF